MPDKTHKPSVLLSTKAIILLKNEVQKPIRYSGRYNKERMYKT